ncbi:3-isopropylmalate isomerase subunit, dehydratase component [uncultured Sphingopyxis sp.]|uniref:3-isopropylmalate dehydratase large subunit n=2 Tax=uncultured Sphingopyxis sp. TaxID=310581 RepID=A0A1Y5PP99_9SPHN|nr:3-isopropylmalate isomerase subunit, dehydratase component [uncultured Sphingopyxis sp.]
MNRSTGDIAMTRSAQETPQTGKSSSPARARTLHDKIWDTHNVTEHNGETILYIDFHLLTEITTAQAFSALEQRNLKVRRPDRSLAIADHNTPTEGQSLGLAGVADPAARLQMEVLEKNTRSNGIEFFPMGDVRNGIVHVVGPEQGRTQPGMTIVCGDSHTSTHGAFGALAMGIGTSQVEHVLATQTLRLKKARNFRVRIEGEPGPGIGAKEFALAVISRIGTGGGTGHVIEYCGSAVSALSMAGRMTLCNMTIEAGARAGIIAPDDVTFAYLEGRPAAPSGAAWDAALQYWKTLFSDEGAHWDRELEIDAAEIPPLITWGTSPEDVIPVTATVPAPAEFASPDKRSSAERALEYMGLEAGQPIAGVKIDVVFIGSCTNSRIEDLRAAAGILHSGRHVAPRVRAMVVPGSGLIRARAEQEGLDKIFKAAGFEWREPGCSMCLGMNPDKLLPGQRCLSTSNRNFEGRQGPGGRTHLASPVMAAAAALAGSIVDFREYL